MKWTISALDCEVSKGELENVVTNVHWRCSLEDVETYGCVSMPEVNPENFKDFDDLSEENVVSWLEGVLDVSSINKRLKDLIEEKRKPTMVTRQLKK